MGIKLSGDCLNFESIGFFYETNASCCHWFYYYYSICKWKNCTHSTYNGTVLLKDGMQSTFLNCVTNVFADMNTNVIHKKWKEKSKEIDNYIKSCIAIYKYW